jgi:hypothetical protein
MPTAQNRFYDIIPDLARCSAAYLIAAHEAVMQAIRQTILSDLDSCEPFEDALTEALDAIEAAILDLPPDRPQNWAAKVRISLPLDGELFAGVDRLRIDSATCLKEAHHA